MVRAAVALVALAGCSFLRMTDPQGAPPVCNSSRVPPIADTVATVAVPILAYAMFVSNNRTSGDGNDAISGVVAFLVAAPVMAVTGASAIYGFRKADRCERAMRDYQPPMAAPPPGYYPPPPPPQGSAPMGPPPVAPGSPMGPPPTGTPSPMGPPPMAPPPR